MTLEVLTGDFKGNTADVDTVLAAQPDVFAHNLETVPRPTHWPSRANPIRCTMRIGQASTPSFVESIDLRTADSPPSC